MSQQGIEYARKYFVSQDTEAQRVLINLKAEAVLPLLQALAEELKEVKDMGWTKETGNAFIDSQYQKGWIDDKGREELRARMEDTPDEGWSEVQVRDFDKAMSTTEELLAQIGTPTEEALTQIIRKENSLLRVTAALVIAWRWKPISASFRERLLTIRQFLINLEGEPTAFLILDAVARAGDEASVQVIRNICKEHHCTPENVHESLIYEAFSFIGQN